MFVLFMFINKFFIDLIFLIIIFIFRSNLLELVALIGWEVALDWRIFKADTWVKFEVNELHQDNVKVQESGHDSVIYINGQVGWGRGCCRCGRRFGGRFSCTHVSALTLHNTGMHLSGEPLVHANGNRPMHIYKNPTTHNKNFNAFVLVFACVLIQNRSGTFL